MGGFETRPYKALHSSFSLPNTIFIGSSMLGHWHAGLLFQMLGSIAAMEVMACEGLAAMLVLAALWWRTPMHRAG